MKTIYCIFKLTIVGLLIAPSVVWGFGFSLESSFADDNQAIVTTSYEPGQSSVFTYSATSSPAEDITGPVLSGDDAGAFSTTVISSSTGSLLAHISFLAAPDYRNPLDVGLDNMYQFAVTSQTLSAAVTQNVSIQVINPSPLIETEGSSSSVLSLILQEGDVLRATSTVSDPLEDEVLFTALTGDDSALFHFDTESGVTVLSGDSFDYEDPQDANLDNVYEIRINAVDIYGASAVQHIQIEVTDVVNEPVFVNTSLTATSTDENTRMNLGTVWVYDPQQIIAEEEEETGEEGDNEDRGLEEDEDEDEDVSTLRTVIVNDSGDSRYFELVNEQGGTTTVGTTSVPTTGYDLYFIEAPDFEDPKDENTDNLYKIEVVAENTSGLVTVHPVAITVNPVNDHDPRFTSFDGAATGSVVMLDEGDYVTTLDAIDGDQPGDLLVFSINASSTDAENFEMDGDDVVFTSDPPEIGQYEVEVNVTDGFATDTQMIRVEVLDGEVNYAPNITNHKGTTTVDVLIDEGYVGVIADLEAVDLHDDTLEWSIEGSDTSWFEIDPDTGILTVSSSTDFENPEDSNADNVYEVVVVVSDEIDQGEEYATSSQIYRVTVEDVEERPMVDYINFSMLEGAVLSQTLYNTWTDLQQDLLHVVHASTSDRLVFEINEVLETVFEEGNDESPQDSDGDGGTEEESESSENATTTAGVVRQSITATTTFDYENPTDENTDNVYQWQVVATDSASNTQTVTYTVDIIDVDEYAPKITTASSSASTSMSLTEGTVAVMTLEGSDEDGTDEMEWRINASSTDGTLFTISSTTGELSFTTAPDFDNPTDSNTDNVYEVEVRLYDLGEDRCITLFNYLEIQEERYGDYIGEVGKSTDNPFMHGFASYDQDVFVEYCGRVFGEIETEESEGEESGISESEETYDSIMVYVTVQEEVVNTPNGTNTINRSNGGGTRYACRDERAVNYQSYGTADPDLCQYQEEVTEVNEIGLGEEIGTSDTQTGSGSQDLFLLLDEGSVQDEDELERIVTDRSLAAINREATVELVEDSLGEDEQIVTLFELAQGKEGERDTHQQALISGVVDGENNWHWWAVTLVVLAGGLYAIRQYLIIIQNLK